MALADGVHREVLYIFTSKYTVFFQICIKFYTGSKKSDITYTVHEISVNDTKV